MLLLLLRHGEPAYPEDRYPDPFRMCLSPKGREEARVAGDGVAAFDPDHIYTSDFRRAVETAEIASSGLGVEIIPISGLRERTFASLAGLDLGDLTRLLGDSAHTVMAGNSDQVNVQGEETYEQARERTLDTVQVMYSEHPAARVLAVAHGGPHAWLLEAALGVDLKGKRVVQLGTGRFSLFSVTQEGMTVERINCTGAAL